MKAGTNSGTIKGLILAGGTGSRLRPITDRLPKQLIPVANKPILFYGIGDLVAAGITEIGMVVSPETGDQIRAAIGDGSSFGADVTYIVQPKPAGLADAVLVAEDFINGSCFVVYLGDNIVRDGITELVSDFDAREPEALILLAAVADPSAFGVAEVVKKRVVRLVEKPKNPPSNLALVGVYLFSPAIFQTARALSPSWRGELEITEAIQGLIDGGADVRAEQICGWWKDTGTVSDLLAANSLILGFQDLLVDGQVDPTSQIRGPVVIERGAVVKNSIINGPTLIGAGSEVISSYVGAHCSVANSKIENSEFANSIISASPFADLHFEDSLVVAGQHLGGELR